MLWRGIDHTIRKMAIPHTPTVEIHDEQEGNEASEKHGRCTT